MRPSDEVPSNPTGRSSRRGRTVTALATLVAAAVVGAGSSAAAGRPSGIVFDTNRDLAVAAASARLASYAVDATGITDCALVDRDALNVAVLAAATTPETRRSPVMGLQLDAWNFGVAVDEALRPDRVPEGQTGGLPIAQCAGNRPVVDTETRPEVFAMVLEPGVTFAEVAHRFGVDESVQVEPARIGGLTSGSCLAATATAVCVSLWQHGELIVGTKLTGPPAALDAWSSAAFLNAIVPDVLDRLSVVTGEPAACTAAALQGATGAALVEEPVCHGGVALSRTVPCPPPAPPSSDPAATSTTVDPATDPCNQFELFHVEPAGWVGDGPVTVLCAEDLVSRGVAGTTAVRFRPACDPASPALQPLTLEPGGSGPAARSLQIALLAQGYRIPLDGTFGPLTQAAVIAYQQAVGLFVDGIVGAQTQESLGL